MHLIGNGCWPLQLTARAWRCAADQDRKIFREEQLTFSLKAATTGGGMAPSPVLYAAFLAPYSKFQFSYRSSQVSSIFPVCQKN
jgi:hypothetical protein